jgi:site-specific DNA recombinase
VVDKLGNLLGRNAPLLLQPWFEFVFLESQEGAGTARFAIVFEEACIVQQIFRWIGQERCAMSEVCRLQQVGVRKQTGKAYWNHKTIWDMLKNPAYKGEAAFGNTRCGPLEPRFRAPRGRPTHSKRGYAQKDVPEAGWILIAVPAHIEPALFEAA